MKFFVCSFLLLTAAIAGERAYVRHKLERRAQRAVNTLRYAVDPQSNNLEPTLVVYYPTHGALCVEYKNLDQAGVPYVGRAVLLDGESRVSYAVDYNDDVWEKNCGEVYSRNLIDLTARVK